MTTRNPLSNTTHRTSSAAPSTLAAVGLLTGVVSMPAARAVDTEVAPEGLTEVVISSRRMEESLQKTPLSVVAVDDEQLVSMGVDSLRSFDVFIPNLSIGGTMGQGSAVANFSIRGVGGASSGFITQESAVGVYIDDVLYAHPNGALLDMLDVEQIEVLRGPQGTLFGRNTAGGALRYTTRKPTNGLGGRLRATLGSFNRTDVAGTLNMPLSETWAARLSYARKSRDGYIRRVVDGRDSGDENSSAARGQLRWQPSDDLDILLAADFVKTFDHGTATTVPAYSANDLYPSLLYSATPPPTVVALRRLTPSGITTFAPGTAAADFARYQVTDRYATYGGNPDRNDFKARSASLSLQYSITDSLTLKSVSAYSHNESRMNQDWDRTPITLFNLDEYITMKYYTQELQLNGTSFDDRLTWVAGLFYFHDESFDDKYRSSPTDGPNAREFKDLTTTSGAAFAQGSYRFSDRYSATLGLRWSRDEKEYITGRNTRNIIAGVPTPYAAPAVTWTDVSPRFGLEQRWTPDVMTYVSAAKGYKAGGLNDSLVNSPGTTVCSPGTAPVSGINPANCGITEFKPEDLMNYEIGIRSEFFDRRVRLNATAFFADYKDMQVQLIDQNPPPTQYNINADATVKGAEVELTALLGERLQLRASYGYTDARYGSDIAAQTIPPPPRAQVPTLAESTPLLRAPKNSFMVGVTHTQRLASQSDLLFDINYGYKSSQSSTSTPTNTIIMPSYGLLNARVAYRSSDRWSLALYGNNLTDKYYLTSAMDPAGPSSKHTFGSSQLHDAVFGFTMLDIGRPREYGLEVSYDF